jgi:hypothetical protein
MLIAMLVGIIFAVVYKLRELYLPSKVFIDIIFFGIAAGLGASGVYSFVNARFPPQTKATIKYTKITKGIGDPEIKEVRTIE